MNSKTIFKFFCAIYVFVYSLLIGPFSVNGDQLHYRDIYESIGDLSLTDAATYYFFHLDSKEIIHFILSWSFSSFNVDKDIFIALSNSCLAYFSTSLFCKYNTSKVIVFIIISSSFYFNVLYFSAERLKFGFIFFIISIIYFDNKKYFYLSLFLAVASHIQMLINYLSIAFIKIMNAIERLVLKALLSKTLLLIILISFLVFLIIGDHIISKVAAYVSEFSIFDVSKILIMMLLTFFYSSNTRNVLYLFLPLIFIVMIIGSDRVLMIGYFVFLYYGIQVNRGFNVGVIVTTFYFTLKSFPYLYNLIFYGNGFYR